MKTIEVKYLPGDAVTIAIDDRLHCATVKRVLAEVIKPNGNQDQNYTEITYYLSYNSYNGGTTL